MTRLAIISAVTTSSPELGFKFRKKWGRATTRILGIRIEELIAIQTNEPVLYVSNHRSMTDPMVQTAVFDSYIIAKNEVGSIPIIGKGAEMTGIVLVKREHLRSRREAQDKTKTLLNEGKSVLVYAEGTTGVEKTTIPFKIGTFKAASELGIPVVPIAIEYRDTKDMWTHGSLVAQLIRQVGQPRTYVKMRMGEPIKHDNAEHLLTLTQSWIDLQLVEMQKDWSKAFS
jgi:1-acyl-sn-glycerol-3-phosphate acyltransferase